MKYLINLIKHWLAGKRQRKVWHLMADNINSQADIIVNKKDTENDKITKIRKWLMDNVEYVKDITQFHVIEYWQSPLQTLKNSKGDCEDINLLFLALLNASGIHPNKLLFCIGWIEANSNKLFHAYGKYEFETDKWRILDAVPQSDSVLYKTPNETFTIMI